MTDLVGQTIGQYIIIEEIGRGGMSTVYRGFQTRIGRDVAIKVLPAQFTHDPTFLARFTREVEIAARLQHHRILSVYDYGEFEGQPYIVMAYMPGGNLEQRIAEGALPLNDVLRLVEQIAEGLDYLHQNGIIHRDFKPSNVLLDAVGNAFLSDFGIARVQEATAHLTGTGIIGTPAYMAPEMFREGAASPASDIYALGVTFYEMLSGLKPFDAETPVQYMRAHLEKPVPDLRRAIPDLPVAVQRVIATALAKDPSMRYPSAGALASALREAVYPTPKKAAAKKQHSIPAWPLMAMGGIIVLGILVVGAFFAIRGSERVSQPEPTSPAVAVYTSAPTGAPTPTETPIPSPTPIPIIGGGTGILGFNIGVNDTILGYTVDVSCVMAGGVGCDPSPHILPEVESITPSFGKWSPDGRRIAFAKTSYSPYGHPRNTLFVVDTNTWTLKNVSNPNWRTYDASWSHDGQSVAFVVESISISPEGAVVPNARTPGIMTAEVDCLGNEVCGGLVPNTSDLDKHPVWSPVGERILFAQWRIPGGDPGGLYVIDRDGRNRVLLPYSGDPDPVFRGQSLQWFPDGQRIIFYSRNLRLFYVAASDGSWATPLSPGIQLNEAPPSALSPDGHLLAFAQSDIYLLDLACLDTDPVLCKDAALPVTKNGGVGLLSWSPDGQWLAFVRYDSGADIYLLNIAQALAGTGESGVTRITHLGSVGWDALEWQPTPSN